MGLAAPRMGSVYPAQQLRHAGSRVWAEEVGHGLSCPVCALYTQLSSLGTQPLERQLRRWGVGLAVPRVGSVYPAQQLRHSGSRAWAQEVEHGLSCPTACGSPQAGVELLPLRCRVGLLHWTCREALPGAPSAVVGTPCAFTELDGLLPFCGC